MAGSLGRRDFLKASDLLPADLTLYCGGEDNFCHRHAGTMPGPFTDRGVLDRREIAAHRVKLVLAQTPTIIDNQAFTTGQIKRSGGETVLPNTLVEFGVKNGVGCDMSPRRSCRARSCRMSMCTNTQLVSI